MSMLGLRTARGVCGEAKKRLWSIALVFLLPALAVVAPVSIANAQETDAVKAPPCDLPPVPSDVTASRGGYTDYVLVTWSGPVWAANVEYQVYRQDQVPGETLQIDVSHARVVRSWQTGTSFADYTAPPPDVLPFSWGCQGSGRLIVVSAFYWVKARNACGESGYSNYAEGWRGIEYEKGWPRPDEKSLIIQEAVPARSAGADGQSAAPDSILYLRLKAGEALDPASVWAQASSASMLAASTAWIPTDATGTDGWVACIPDAPWPAGDTVTATAGGKTISGTAVETAKAEFVVDAEAGADSTGGKTTLATLDGTEAVPGFAGAIGQTYRICPDAAFDAPQEIWLPVPEGVDIKTLDLYYFHASGSREGWHLAKNVQGFLEPDSREVGELDGVTYLGFLVHHAGIVRLGRPGGAVVTMQAAVVPLFPTREPLGDVLLLLTTVVILRVAGGRCHFVRGRKTH